jgi:riboflavin synthase
VFTGIVTQRAEVVSRKRVGRGADAADRLVVRLATKVPGLARGDSLAIDGTCLTVAALHGRLVAFDVVPETLRRTTLCRCEPGDRVNVEPALRAGQALGGHLVQGHVDGVGIVESLTRRGEDVRMEIRLPEPLRGAAIEKGSIAVDGVSLTVGEAEDRRFSVYLIPHTLAVTGLGAKGAGDSVNLEADLVGRWIEHHVRRLVDGRLLGGGGAGTGRPTVSAPDVARLPAEPAEGGRPEPKKRGGAARSPRPAVRPTRRKR